MTTLIADSPEIEVVGEAVDGRAAGDLTRRMKPDLLFFDVQMPDSTGSGASMRSATMCRER